MHVTSPYTTSIFNEFIYNKLSTFAGIKYTPSTIKHIPFPFRKSYNTYIKADCRVPYSLYKYLQNVNDKIYSKLTINITADSIKSILKTNVKQEQKIIIPKYNISSTNILFYGLGVYLATINDYSTARRIAYTIKDTTHNNSAIIRSNDTEDAFGITPAYALYMGFLFNNVTDDEITTSNYGKKLLLDNIIPEILVILYRRRKKDLLLPTSTLPPIAVVMDYFGKLIKNPEINELKYSRAHFDSYAPHFKYDPPLDVVRRFNNRMYSIQDQLEMSGVIENNYRLNVCNGIKPPFGAEIEIYYSAEELSPDESKDVHLRKLNYGIISRATNFIEYILNRKDGYYSNPLKDDLIIALDRDALTDDKLPLEDLDKFAFITRANISFNIDPKQFSNINLVELLNIDTVIPNVITDYNYQYNKEHITNNKILTNARGLRIIAQAAAELIKVNNNVINERVAEGIQSNMIPPIRVFPLILLYTMYRAGYSEYISKLYPESIALINQQKDAGLITLLSVLQVFEDDFIDFIQDNYFNFDIRHAMKTYITQNAYKHVIFRLY